MITAHSNLLSNSPTDIAVSAMIFSVCNFSVCSNGVFCLKQKTFQIKMRAKPTHTSGIVAASLAANTQWLHSSSGGHPGGERMLSQRCVE